MGLTGQNIDHNLSASSNGNSLFSSGKFVSMKEIRLYEFKLEFRNSFLRPKQISKAIMGREISANIFRDFAPEFLGPEWRPFIFFDVHTYLDAFH